MSKTLQGGKPFACIHDFMSVSLSSETSITFRSSSEDPSATKISGLLETEHRLWRRITRNDEIKLGFLVLKEEREIREKEVRVRGEERIEETETWCTCNEQEASMVVEFCSGRTFRVLEMFVGNWNVG